MASLNCLSSIFLISGGLPCGQHSHSASNRVGRLCGFSKPFLVMCVLWLVYSPIFQGYFEDRRPSSNCDPYMGEFHCISFLHQKHQTIMHYFDDFPIQWPMPWCAPAVWASRSWAAPIRPRRRPTCARWLRPWAPEAKLLKADLLKLIERNWDIWWFGLLAFGMENISDYWLHPSLFYFIKKS